MHMTLFIFSVSWQPDINHINIAYNCRFTYIIQDPAVTHMQGEITEGAQHLQTGM